MGKVSRITYKRGTVAAAGLHVYTPQRREKRFDLTDQ